MALTVLLDDKTPRKGEIYSQTIDISPDVAKFLVFTVLISDASIRDVSLYFDLFIEVSTDGINWVRDAGFTCYGEDASWQHPPSLGVPSSIYKGKKIRVRLNTNKIVKIGVDVEDKISDDFRIIG